MFIVVTRKVPATLSIPIGIPSGEDPVEISALTIGGRFILLPAAPDDLDRERGIVTLALDADETSAFPAGLNRIRIDVLGSIGQRIIVPIEVLPPGKKWSADALARRAVAEAFFHHGIPAVYRSLDDAAIAQDVRIIIRRDVEVLGELGQIADRRTEIDVMRAQLEALKKGDRLELSQELFVVDRIVSDDGVVIVAAVRLLD